MAATSSVSGLVSGLDTASIVSSLMQIEAQPQTLLKTQLTSQQSVVSSLQGLNAKLASLATKAGDLAKASAWSTYTATSSSTAVTASAGTTATAGSLNLTVQRTAAAHQLSFATTAAATDVVTTGPTVTLTKHDGTQVPVDTGDGSLAGLVKGINAAGAGVTATMLRLDGGSYRLQVRSDTTGEASDFTLTNSDGGALLGGAAVTAGQDAEITVGADTIHSATNTFGGLTTGLDVTIADGTQAGTTATVTVARDATAAQTALQGLVDAANDILTTIDGLTAYDSTTKKSGVLSGDATVRALRGQVLDTVTRAADGSSMAAVGVQTDRDGKITFDTTAFAKAYATNPSMVATKLGATAKDSVPGFAARLATMAGHASNSTDGTLTSSIMGRQSSVTSLQKQIDDWDVRLAARQDSLNKQYAALEVALGKLQDQSSWLSGQIASLSSSSSSSS
jgi:flagellar hook-associated protein 2